MPIVAAAALYNSHPEMSIVLVVVSTTQENVPVWHSSDPPIKSFLQFVSRGVRVVGYPMRIAPPAGILSGGLTLIVYCVVALTVESLVVTVIRGSAFYTRVCEKASSVQIS